MAQLSQPVDTNNVDPNDKFEPVPPGDYKVWIIKSEVTATKAGTGELLNLELDIIEGPFQGRKLFDRLNIVNPNQTAQEIGQRALSQITHAIGKVGVVTDSEQLHGVPMMAKVIVKPEETKNGVWYDKRNEIKKYSAVDGSKPAPRPQAPQGQPQSSPPPDAAPAPSGPPKRRSWGSKG